MTRLTVPLLALGLLTLPAAGEDPVPWANKLFTKKGADVPPVIVHDFGIVPKGAVRTHRFQLANIYAVPINVGEPLPSSGCVSVTKYAAKLDPSETGFIDIQIDTRRVDGKKEVRLSVYFEGKDPKTGETFWSWARVEIRVVSR